VLGWIDGLVRSVDQAYYAQRFTPRRPGSEWSALNRARFAKLLREGRVTKAGLAQAPPAEPVEPREAGDRERRSAAVPAEFRRALRANPAAWRTFEGLAPSYRRLYVKWITAAKRETTRARRIDEAVGLLAAGKKLGLK
jgi:uncharacterized protein YdeI (YjbR/CyaY-like superfamily)